MVTTAAIFFVRWLEKSLYDCLEVLHSQTTGQLSLFVSGMLESKMAAVTTVLDWENLGFLWWAMRGIHMSTAGVDFSSFCVICWRQQNAADHKYVWPVERIQDISAAAADAAQRRLNHSIPRIYRGIQLKNHNARSHSLGIFPHTCNLHHNVSVRFWRFPRAAVDALPDRKSTSFD